MNIGHLFEHKKIVYSLEVFPPKVKSPVDMIYTTLYGLRGIACDYISVTYGAGGSDTQKIKTCEIASLIKSEYNIEPVAHLTCVSSTREEVADMLGKLKENGIQNILALRGDITPEMTPKKEFGYASDLASFIREYDSSFHISGACYPECHFEAETLDQDIENLKRKIDAGVSHLVTQLFFDNEIYYQFMDRVIQKGICVPVSAGIMPIIKKTQIERTVSMCGASLPRKFTRMISKYADSPAALQDAGIAYAMDQIVDLIAGDVRGIHLYTMNNVEVAAQISNGIGNLIKSGNASPQ